MKKTLNTQIPDYGIINKFIINPKKKTYYDCKYSIFGQIKQIYTQKILQKRAKMRKISKNFSILNKKRAKKRAALSRLLWVIPPNRG